MYIYIYIYIGVASQYILFLTDEVESEYNFFTWTLVVITICLVRRQYIEYSLMSSIPGRSPLLATNSFRSNNQCFTKRRITLVAAVESLMKVVQMLQVLSLGTLS